MPTPSPFYPLTPAPTPPSNDTGSGATSTTAASAFREFLGFGLIAPLRRDQKQDFANAGGLELVRACVAEIIGTRCSGTVAGSEQQGELEWRPEFGTLLFRMIHRNGFAAQELGRIYIIDALRRWEPRVVITDTNFSFDATLRVLTIRIKYNVIDVNVPGNQVIVRDVEQTINLPIAA